MIRHLVVFTFADHVGPIERAELLAELDRFPARFPAMRNWTRGDNISRRDDTFEHAFVVDFDSEAELVSYLGSEAHERFVTERWKPNIARRAIVSFDVGDPDQPATTPAS